MAQLAIKGHKTRGKEVIEILEMLGGSNPHNYRADCESLCFHIGENTNSIDYDWVWDCYEDGNTLIFTLEEFLEKYPYKVEESVSSKYLKNYKIEKAEWESGNNRVIYKLQGMGWYSVGELEPYKEETMEEKDEKSANHVFDTEIISFDIAQRDRYELDLQGKFNVVLREGKYYVERIKPRYPKTYEECCKVLNLTKYPPALVPNKVGFITQYEDFPYYYEIQKLAELLVCRNAYWKIAGEQMGLGRPWEPDWNNNSQFKYLITCWRANIIKETYSAKDCILAFPTKEMRDEFYENFKDLIELCKELL